MSFSEKPIGVRMGIVGSVVLPVVYIISLSITRDPDLIVFVLGPLGFIFFIVQWIAFLIGGWILAVVATTALLALIGYYLGRLLGWVIKKLKK